MQIKEAGEKDLPTVADWVLSNKRSSILLLKGEMGSGKTTLVKAITKNLGISDVVNSPTFSLVNEYHYSKGIVYHFDFYRIENEEEAMDMGVDEYFDSGELCLIEWPEKIRNLIPLGCDIVEISKTGSHRNYKLIQPT